MRVPRPIEQTGGRRADTAVGGDCYWRVGSSSCLPSRNAVVQCSMHVQCSSRGWVLYCRRSLLCRRYQPPHPAPVLLCYSEPVSITGHTAPPLCYYVTVSPYQPQATPHRPCVLCYSEPVSITGERRSHTMLQSGPPARSTGHVAEQDQSQSLWGLSNACCRPQWAPNGHMPIAAPRQ